MNLYQHIITTQQNLHYGLTFTWLHWVFVAACKLLGVACRIVFWPGIKAGPLHWQHGVFSHWTTRGVPGFTLGVACSMGLDKCIITGIYNYSIKQEFHRPKNPLLPCHHPQHLTTTFFFTQFTDYSFRASEVHSKTDRKVWRLHIHPLLVSL